MNTPQPLLWKRLALVGLTATAFAVGTTAMAGECPANQRVADGKGQKKPGQPDPQQDVPVGGGHIGLGRRGDERGHGPEHSSRRDAVGPDAEGNQEEEERQGQQDNRQDPCSPIFFL